GFDIGDEIAAELLEIDIASPHDGRSVLVIDQREQQMLERRILVVPLIGESERPVERLLKAARESGHQGLFASGPTLALSITWPDGSRGHAPAGEAAVIGRPDRQARS